MAGNAELKVLYDASVACRERLDAAMTATFRLFKKRYPHANVFIGGAWKSTWRTLRGALYLNGTTLDAMPPEPRNPR
jgi:hypothetical protein